MLFLALVVFPYLDAVRTLATNAAVTLHATAVVAAQQQEAPQPPQPPRLRGPLRRFVIPDRRAFEETNLSIRI